MKAGGNSAEHDEMSEQFKQTGSEIYVKSLKLLSLTLRRKWLKVTFVWQPGELAVGRVAVGQAAPDFTVRNPLTF